MRKATAVSVPPYVRRSAVWNALLDVLTEYDVRASVGRGKRHYFVRVEVGHTSRKHFFSADVRDTRSINNNASKLRRVIASAQANVGEVRT